MSNDQYSRVDLRWDMGEVLTPCRGGAPATGLYYPCYWRPVAGRIRQSAS